MLTKILFKSMSEWLTLIKDTSVVNIQKTYEETYAGVKWNEANSKVLLTTKKNNKKPFS